MDHCVAKIVAIVAGSEGDRRAVFQLGYNLGRLSEITGLGREPFWDRWKEAVAAWDRPALEILARDLQDMSLHPSPPPHAVRPADAPGSEDVIP